MKVKFLKGINKSRPNEWVSNNLFYTDDNNNAIKKYQMKETIRVLKEYGFCAEIKKFNPNNWTITIDAVCLTLNEADEAHFILLTNDGIEI